MLSSRKLKSAVPLMATITVALICGARQHPSSAPPRTDSQAAKSSAPDAQSKTEHYVSVLPRGTRLMLKSGSYELVREYEIQGDRVRYYSLDGSQWEVIPTAIVDWDATKKEEAEEEKNQDALASKIQKQEDEHSAVQSLDIDASLEIAPGIFLPPGVGLFAFDGKSAVQVPQAETDSHVSKTRFLERVLVPVPLVPSRHVISIPGEHSKFRLNNQPEFYLRTTDARTPDVELIRAKVHGGA
ncbi:MAG: hypothetical protein KGL02_14925, partial [Acidobacteriota bacterium]|nr:hypothetical protein [Acidobacteriota bacterium]